jgi:hypothetical protein
MKLLLGCVNSLVSLVGYDTEAQKSFWYCPANILRVCGIDYTDSGLVIASDNSLYEITAAGIHEFRLPGPHDNLAHSVHVGDTAIGIADTGNSRLLFKDPGGSALISYDPLEGWDERPADAIHLNDFIPWKNGFLASCFSFKPFGALKANAAEWHRGGHGLILHMYRSGGMTVTRIVASGLSCPHSLRHHDGRVYCCSSKDGTFIEFHEHENGMLYESARTTITGTHFLRGALRHEKGWLLGGSSVRRGNGHTPMVVFDHDPETGTTRTLPVARTGEIYEIMPWRDEVMAPLVDIINALPVSHEDENTYPPVTPLETW